jgi:hypothetical protein
MPQLKVINQSPDPLLILDGEELIGAKQNRVVNATLLLKARSETIIPVSCTEQGRWRHVSNAFSSSDVVMEMKVRRAKVRSVSDSLKAGSGHASDQGEVWNEIQALHAKAMHASPTNAMHDLFVERENDLRAALAAFPAEPGQHGLLVSIRGQVVGCDLLSRADAYGRLHGKLVRSYVLDALLGEPGVPKADEAQAREFLTSAAKCREERFPSVGCGESVRLQNGQTAGAALIHEGTVIHVALFRLDPMEEAAAGSRKMARLAQRRRRFIVADHTSPVVLHVMQSEGIRVVSGVRGLRTHGLPFYKASGVAKLPMARGHFSCESKVIRGQFQETESNLDEGPSSSSYERMTIVAAAAPLPQGSPVGGSCQGRHPSLPASVASGHPPFPGAATL